MMLIQPFNNYAILKSSNRNVLRPDDVLADLLSEVIFIPFPESAGRELEIGLDCLQMV